MRCADNPATRFYALTPTAMEVRPATNEPNLSIDLGPVDLLEIVTRLSASEVEQAEFDQWAEPLSD
jgi:ABC-type transport auxiliary lipoprotein component